jgi:GNAT superfamily N-acetyltransferase
MYSGDNVSTVVQDLIQTLKKYPNNVYLRILASIDTNVGRGSGQWSILDSDREGVFSIDSHRYSIKIPSLSTKILKSLVFEKELKRNLAKDYIDSVPNTCYHVIIDYQGVIIAQCRETPYANLVPKEKKIYRVFNEEECTYLSKFCVRQDFRNTGIAHRLGACVVKHLFNKGVRIIALNICPRHLFLYKRIGFVECGNQFFSDEVGELVIPLIGDLHKIINHRALIGMLI